MNCVSDVEVKTDGKELLCVSMQMFSISWMILA